VRLWITKEVRTKIAGDEKGNLLFPKEAIRERVEISLT
jgi:hypothetical protein